MICRTKLLMCFVAMDGKLSLLPTRGTRDLVSYIAGDSCSVQLRGLPRPEPGCRLVHGRELFAERAEYAP